MLREKDAEQSVACSTTAKPTALSDASLPSDGGRFLNELTSLLGDVKRMVM